MSDYSECLLWEPKMIFRYQNLYHDSPKNPNNTMHRRLILQIVVHQSFPYASIRQHSFLQIFIPCLPYLPVVASPDKWFSSARDLSPVSSPPFQWNSSQASQASQGPRWRTDCDPRLEQRLSLVLCLRIVLHRMKVARLGLLQHEELRDREQIPWGRSVWLLPGFSHEDLSEALKKKSNLRLEYHTPQDFDLASSN